MSPTLARNSGNYMTDKDLVIMDLERKLSIEREIKETYQKKSLEYMINYIKAEKRRKEIELYLGIKRKARQRNIKGAALISGVVLVICIFVYLIFNI